MSIDKIVFFSDSHTYWLGDQNLPSVGSVIKRFVPEFESDYWLTHKALVELGGDKYMAHYRSFKTMSPPADKLFGPWVSKFPLRKFKEAKLKIKHTWDRKRYESQHRGKLFHAEIENQTFSDKFLINPWKEKKFPVEKFEKFYDNESLMMDLSQLPDGAYPELLIFNLDMPIAGQADEVFIETIKGKRYVDINDHKTGEEKPKKSGPEWCFKPFQNNYACSHFKYTLQINMYAYLLSKFGFIPRNLGYTYYRDFNIDQATLIEVENLQLKLRKIFDFDLAKAV